MNMYMVGKRIIAVFGFLAISIAVSSAETACDGKSAENPGGAREIVAANVSSVKSTDVKPGKLFEGTWTGQVKTMDGITKVSLTIKPGDGQASLSYGGKRSCTAQGGYEGEDNDKRIFSLTSQNGGKFCDKLDSLAVWNSGTNILSYEVSSRNKPVESGKLSRSAN